MKQYNFIFWDFDGTLVNTIEGTRKSAVYALKHFGIEEDNKDLGKIFCGPPLKESFKRFGLQDEQIDKAIMLYRKYQAENTIETNKVYRGVVEVLKELKERNKTLIVLTLKFQETAIKILKYTEIYKYFDFVYGVTEESPKATKTEMLANVLEKIENVKTEECIMIGDRSSDVIAGKVNHVDTIGVTYGIDGEEHLKKAKPTFLTENPWKILDIIN